MKSARFLLFVWFRKNNSLGSITPVMRANATQPLMIGGGGGRRACGGAKHLANSRFQPLCAFNIAIYSSILRRYIAKVCSWFVPIQFPRNPTSRPLFSGAPPVDFLLYLHSKIPAPGPLPLSVTFDAIIWNPQFF